MKKSKRKGEESLLGGELVVQHNKLIEARYSLTLQEKRMILWLASKIKFDDVDFQEYRLSIKDFSKMANINNNKLYEEVMEITEKLMKRVIKIKDIRSKRTIQISWLSSAEYLHNEGCVLICFDPKLKLYLLSLKQEFTKINLADLFELRSLYSIRIFELLMQYESTGKREISLTDLREYCGIQEKEYSDYFDLKRFVIERAKREINAKTNYKIDYREIKESRKVTAIEWTIKKQAFFEKQRLEKSSIIQKEICSQNELIKNLNEYGFSRLIAKKFLEQESEEVIRNAIKAVNIQVERGNVKNPRAMLKTAILEHWKPDIYVAKKKKS